MMGQSPVSSSYNTDGIGLPFYQGNADFGEVSPVARVWCTDPKKVAQPGDILISVRAPIGAINIAAEKCCIGRGLAAIRPIGSNLDVDYLVHLFRASRHRIESMGTGSTFKAVGKKVLSELLIPVYCQERQREIAFQLTRIIECIRASGELANELDSVVKSRFAEMFGDPVSNDRGWVVSTIKETASTYGDGPFGSNLKTSDYVDEGVRVIRLGNIQQGRFSEKDHSFVSYEKYELLKRYECLPGEIVIATLGDPILRACLVPGSCSPSIHKADCMYYEVDRNKLIPIFAMWAINHSSMLRRAMVDVHGQTRGRINSTQVGNLPMVVPPLALQQEFADFAARVDKSRFVVRS